MNIAFVGCGYIADLYKQTLGSHLDLRLLGVFDRDAARLAAFATAHGVKAYGALEDLLADPILDVVVNLTPSRYHADVTRTLLEAGKNVYCDKLLALSLDEARSLIALAESKGLHLGVGPCTHLSEGVQTLAKAIASGKLGQPLLVQAEMDTSFATAPWQTVSGAPWPVPEEIEVGCVLENAGSQIAPLVQLFGPVRRVTAFSTRSDAAATAPDAAFGLLEFDHNVTARLSVSSLGPINRSLRVVGTGGTATLSDVWDFPGQARFSPAGSSGTRPLLRWAEKILLHWAPGISLGAPLLSAKPSTMVRLKGGGPRFEAARGIAAVADAVRGQPNRTPAALALHVLEVSWALQAPPGSTPTPITTIPTIPPLYDWAQ